MTEEMITLYKNDTANTALDGEAPALPRTREGDTCLEVILDPPEFGKLSESAQMKRRFRCESPASLMHFGQEEGIGSTHSGKHDLPKLTTDRAYSKPMITLLGARTTL